MARARFTSAPEGLKADVMGAMVQSKRPSVRTPCLGLQPASVSRAPLGRTYEVIRRRGSTLHA